MKQSTPNVNLSSSNTLRPVVVSGIGVVSCLGVGIDLTWKRLLLGELGYLPGGCGNIEDFSVMTHRAAQLAMTATRMALKDAQVETTSECGVIIGSSRGSQADWEKSGGTELIELAAPMRSVANLVGSRGPVEAIACACATGAWAIGTGYRWIQWGLCDQVIVGAVDAPITPLNLAGFRKAGTLATTHCRPFDRQRDGFVLSEGAAVLILESENVALERGILPYAWIRGFAANSDAYHPTAPRPDGSGLERATRQVFVDSGFSTVSAISAHATGTPMNDALEAAVIARLHGTEIPVISAKGQLGHSLGASSALETAIACQVLRTGILPPIANLEQPLSELNFIRTATLADLDTVLLHSLGFGGQNTALLLEAFR
jgi:3-oxoacyl-[acyl-carrier-protein] synthase II